MKYLFILFLLSFCCLLVFSQNPPSVQISDASFNYVNNKLTVHYEVTDVDGDMMTVLLRVSTDTGHSYVLNTSNATGDVGPNILSGTNYEIKWEAPKALNPLEVRVKLVAYDDETPDIAGLVAQVDSNRLLSDLQWMASGPRHRITGPILLEATKDSIQARFESAGLTTSRQAFGQFGYIAHNIIGRKQGLLKDTVTYLIDGHFDTVGNAPGANDNGSAVAGMLEAMRILSQYEFEHSIRFLGFDLEEAGLLGSIEYVTRGIPDYDSIMGVLNLEMIGYYDNAPNTQNFPTGFDLLFPAAYNMSAQDSFRGNFLSNVANTFSTPLMQKFDSVAAQYVPDLLVYSGAVPGNGQIAPDVRRSDHTPFWEGNMMALFLNSGGDFRDPNYHSPNDTVGNINFAFMRHVVQAVVATTAHLAKPLNAGYAESEMTINSQQDISPVLPDRYVWLHPNPGSSFLLLEAPERVAEVNILDSTGRLLETVEGGAKNLRISMERYPSGIYLIQSRFPSGAWTGKWLKQ